MPLTREAIVEGLRALLGPEKVDTDAQTLNENSLDRYRKLEDIFGIYRLPIPAAVVRVESTDDVASTLAFCNEHRINVVPKTGGTATEGGLETIAENSVVIDGKRMDQILHIDEFNEAFGTRLPEDVDVETLGGLIALRLGRIPAQGDRIVHEGTSLEVTAADERRVTRVLVKLP